MRRRGRRGGGIAFVFLVMFALLAVALSALSVVAASAAAVERDYRASQALALAEAGVAAAQAEIELGAARSGRPRRVRLTSHDTGEGLADWQADRRGSHWRVYSLGSVETPQGRRVHRMVRAEFARQGGRWVITHWRELRQ